jgi:hypothetical protein
MDLPPAIPTHGLALLGRGIPCRNDGVTIVSLFGSRHCRWQDIDYFAILPLGNYQNVGQAVLADGRVFSTYGVSGSRWAGSREKVQGAVDELNDALEAWRGLHPGDLPTAGRPS